MVNSRYARQISLAEIGRQGQQKLDAAKVAIIGCGGLGAIVAAYLAGAGVGQLLLIDGDLPSLSNLHRQVFYDETETDKKVVALAQQLRKRNSSIQVEVYADYLRPQQATELLDGLTLVVECTDQADLKHWVSDFCALRRIPLLYGAVHRYQGYVALFPNSQPTDCHLRDLFPEPDDQIPDCATVGVLNTAAGLIGMLQANEAIKWIVGMGQSLANRLLTYDCLSQQQQIITLRKTFTDSLTDLWAATLSQSLVNSQEPDFVANDLLVTESLAITWATLATWPAATYHLFSLLPEAQEAKVVVGASRYQKGSLEKNGKKVFYCQQGRQSLQVAQQLRAKGILAYSLQGGLAAKDR